MKITRDVATADRDVCERRKVKGLGPVEGVTGWVCLNDITGCLWNDGHNCCGHEGEDRFPLEEKCPTCKEPQSYHEDDIMPGQAFVEGMGIVPCDNLG